jgi:hypothetical protein
MDHLFTAGHFFPARRRYSHTAPALHQGYPEAGAASSAQVMRGMTGIGRSAFHRLTVTAAGVVRLSAAVPSKFFPLYHFFGSHHQ